MRDRMKYINHVGEEIEFGKGNILINENDFRNYQWGYVSKNERIQKFTRNVSNKSLPVIVYGENAREIADRLFEVIEKDVLEKKTGKMYIGDYYITGFFFETSKSGYTKQNSIELSLGFVSEDACWISQQTHHFNSTSTASSDNKRYSYKYPYRYASGLNTSYIINPHFADSNFKMIIYGPVVNPQVTIGGNQHLVYIVLEQGEYLEIDSRAGTLVKVMQNGERINAFHNRQKGKAFFRKIPPGRQNISFSNNMIFDLFIYEERSEPKW